MLVDTTSICISISETRAAMLNDTVHILRVLLCKPTASQSAQHLLTTTLILLSTDLRQSKADISQLALVRATIRNTEKRGIQQSPVWADATHGMFFVYFFRTNIYLYTINRVPSIPCTLVSKEMTDWSIIRNHSVTVVSGVNVSYIFSTPIQFVVLLSSLSFHFARLFAG